MFIGSPLEVDKNEMEKLAKRLKKEKVNVDIVSYGDHQKNNDVLTAFINTLNGKDGTGSHLVSVPRGSQLQEALISSPIIQGEDGMGAGIGGAGFEFGVDPNEDPELALALRVSMEEQRQRQEEEQRRAQVASAQESDSAAPPAITTAAPTSDEAMLERALALSTETPVKRHRVRFASSFLVFFFFKSSMFFTKFLLTFTYLQNHTMEKYFFSNFSMIDFGKLFYFILDTHKIIFSE